METYIQNYKTVASDMDITYRIHSFWTPCPVRQDVAAAIRRAPQQTENQQ